MPLFAERVNRGLNAPDHPFHVDAVNLVDNFRRDGFDRGRRRHPGVIDDDVEAAQRSAGFFHRRKHLVAVRDVHLHGDGFPAVAGDLIRDRFRRLFVVIRNSDGKAVLHQAKRDRFANPLAGAGYESHFLHFSVLILIHKIWLRWSWPISSGLSL